jgi:hemoglobin-like flavoprotein
MTRNSRHATLYDMSDVDASPPPTDPRNTRRTKALDFTLADSDSDSDGDGAPTRAPTLDGAKPADACPPEIQEQPEPSGPHDSPSSAVEEQGTAQPREAEASGVLPPATGDTDDDQPLQTSATLLCSSTDASSEDIGEPVKYDDDYVRESWSVVARDGDLSHVGELFYETLFASDATLKDTLFRTADMRTQSTKLLSMIDSAVKLLDDRDSFTAVLIDLGESHTRYGVEASHYPVVGAALIETLRQGLGAAMSAEVEAAWVRTFALIQSAMLQGAATATGQRQLADYKARHCAATPEEADTDDEPLSDEEQVRQSWALVVGDNLAMVGDLFYAVLFESAASLEDTLFKNVDMRTQATKLMTMIDVAVGLLDKPDDLVPVLLDLGRRHHRYGVEEAHFPVVGSALITALRTALAAAMTADVEAAWERTYGTLQWTMQQGMAAAAEEEQQRQAADATEEDAGDLSRVEEEEEPEPEAEPKGFFARMQRDQRRWAARNQVAAQESQLRRDMAQLEVDAEHCTFQPVIHKGVYRTRVNRYLTEFPDGRDEAWRDRAYNAQQNRARLSQQQAHPWRFDEPRRASERDSWRSRRTESERMAGRLSITSSAASPGVATPFAASPPPPAVNETQQPAQHPVVPRLPNSTFDAVIAFRSPRPSVVSGGIMTARSSVSGGWSRPRPLGPSDARFAHEPNVGRVMADPRLDTDAMARRSREREVSAKTGRLSVEPTAFQKRPADAGRKSFTHF